MSDALARAASRWATPRLPPGGQPPYDDGMEARVAKLETLTEKTVDRLARIETDIAVLKKGSEMFATKSDVSEAKAAIIMWVVGAIFLAQMLQVLPAVLRAFRVIP